MGIHSLPARRWGRIGLVALLGLTLTLVTVSAGHATAGPAVAAKKKCKKKHRSATSAKKKKCKKLKRVVLPAPAPLVRGTVSWSSGDLDLHAFDASGAHAGYETAVAGVADHIASTSHSGDVQGGGTESFTDDIFVIGGSTNREFSYAVCFYTSTTATFTGVTRTGQSSSLPITAVAGNGIALTTPGGPPVPSTFACP